MFFSNSSLKEALLTKKYRAENPIFMNIDEININIGEKNGTSLRKTIRKNPQNIEIKT
jgi:hypothetical protein